MTVRNTLDLKQERSATSEVTDTRPVSLFSLFLPLSTIQLGYESIYDVQNCENSAVMKAVLNERENMTQNTLSALHTPTHTYVRKHPRLKNK